MSVLHLPKSGLNISRASLPQVLSTDVPDYLVWLKQHKHISSIRTELSVSALHPSQGNFNQSKIRDFMTHKREELRKPIIVSSDHYVVDGHHRFVALLNLDPHDTIPVILTSAKILDLIAATKEYPKSFTKNVVESFAAITEAAERHAVLTFGRFNPPTAGHAKLVDKVHEIAKRHDAHHEVVLSHSQDAKSNPLSQADKIRHAKRAFPGTNITPSSKAEPSIFHHAAKINKTGVQHLHVVVGGDRVKEFKKSLNDYNGHFDAKGNGYKFKSIQVHSAGARDESAKGVEGMSASKLREHAARGNFKEFQKGVSPHMSPEHTKELYQDVRKGQGHLKESWYNTKVGHVEFKKPNPKCKECGGTGYRDNYNAHGSPAAPGFGTHNSSPCSCTSKWVEAKLKEEVEQIDSLRKTSKLKEVWLPGGAEKKKPEDVVDSSGYLAWAKKHAKELYDDVRRGQVPLKETVRSPWIKGIDHDTASENESVRIRENKKKPENQKTHGFKPAEWTHPNGHPRCIRCGEEESISGTCHPTMKEEVEYLNEGVHDAGIFKVVFLAGAPGSGKDFVMKKALHGHGLVEIDSDTALEHLMDKHKLDKKMPEHEQEKRGEIRDKAKSLTALRQRLALHGRNGLIINSTGAKKEQIKKIKDMVEELGYSSKMVFVDTSDNVSRNRNVERGQRGGRMIPEKLRTEKWRQAQDSRVHFAKLFGAEHYHEFNNDEDLRHNTDPEIHTQKTKELDDIFKTVKKFTQQPPEHPVAQEWIHKSMGKLAKQPVGNKQQQTSQIPASNDSAATEEARKLGLQYYGYGRYGKNARVSHFSLNGKLVEKKKALTPPKSLQANTAQPQAPKKLNEAFEDLLQEDNEHGTLSDLQSSNSMDNLGLVVGPEVLARELQHILAEGLAEGGTSDNSMEYADLRDLGIQRNGGAGETIEEKSQEEKISFGAFRNRLVVSIAGRTQETLQEGEPTKDVGGEGGPILGTGSAEVIDPTNGGVATSGPKKTLKKFKEDIK